MGVFDHLKGQIPIEVLRAMEHEITTQEGSDDSDIAPASINETKLAHTVAGPPQVITAAGVLSVALRTSRITSAAPAQAMTLAGGTKVGQRKSCVLSGGGTPNTARITPTSFGDGSYVTLSQLLDSVEFEWDGLFWWVVNLGQTATVTI